MLIKYSNSAPFAPGAYANDDKKRRKLLLMTVYGDGPPDVLVRVCVCLP